MELFSGGGWIRPALLALFFWGLWGFLTKLGSDKIPWQSMMVLFGGCTLMFGLLNGSVKMNMDLNHLVALAAGIAGAIGFLYFFVALSKGPASAVIPVTSLYVAVASILAFIILAEPLSLKKILGILSAVIAVALLSG